MFCSFEVWTFFLHFIASVTHSNWRQKVPFIETACKIVFCESSASCMDWREMSFRWWMLYRTIFPVWWVHMSQPGKQWLAEQNNLFDCHFAHFVPIDWSVSLHSIAAQPFKRETVWQFPSHSDIQKHYCRKNASNISSTSGLVKAWRTFSSQNIQSYFDVTANFAALGTGGSRFVRICLDNLKLRFIGTVLKITLTSLMC